MMTEQEREERRRLWKVAEGNARRILKPGDRLRVTKCPGTKRWIVFAGWDGYWIVSKSGIDDYSPLNVDRLNGTPIDFSEPAPHVRIAKGARIDSAVPTNRQSERQK